MDSFAAKYVFINNRYFLTHCFFSTKKEACKKKIYRSVRVFERKIFNFFFKNTHTPKKPFPARL